MTQTEVEKRIFVVGAPRSGTTLVQCLLAAHSTLTSFPESHFFSRHFLRLPFVPITVLHKDPRPRLHDFLLESGADPRITARLEAQFDRLVPPGWLFAPRTIGVGRALLKVLDELAISRGTSGWIEKTPMHLHYIAMIEWLSKPSRQTHFVHVIRRGSDVVSSLYKASQSWDRAYDLATCITRWEKDIGLSLRRVPALNDHFVFYEDLTTRTEETLQRLTNELDLEWEPEILDRYTDTAAMLVSPSEVWKADVGRRIGPSAAYGSTLSENQRERIETSLNHALYEEIARAVARPRHP